MRGQGLSYTSKHRLWIATSGNLKAACQGQPLKPLVNMSQHTCIF